MTEKEKKMERAAWLLGLVWFWWEGGGDEFSPLFTGVMNKCHAKIFNLMKLKQLASY